MKNLAIAAGVLVIVLVAVFMFSTKKGNSDTLIPSQAPLPSEGLQFLGKPKMSEETNLGNKKTYSQAPSPLAAEEIEKRVAKIETEKGTITIQFFKDAPLAASNFIFLSQEGFYNGLTFHRREEGFVIKGGDPKGDGTGGLGYTFADEPVTRDYTRGIVAMANAGPNTNGSQFFILLTDAPGLPKKYTIFGQVAEGMEVVDQIKAGDAMRKVTIE